MAAGAGNTPPQVRGAPRGERADDWSLVRSIDPDAKVVVARDQPAGCDATCVHSSPEEQRGLTPRLAWVCVTIGLLAVLGIFLAAETALVRSARDLVACEAAGNPSWQCRPWIR